MSSGEGDRRDVERIWMGLEVLEEGWGGDSGGGEGGGSDIVMRDGGTDRVCARIDVVDS
jgi:hypothetical protein